MNWTFLAFFPVLLFLFWSFWFEPRQLVVREIELALPGWTANGVRIALLSDLHVGSPHLGLSKLRQIVHRTNEANPDLILFLGDLIPSVVGGHPIPPEACASVLGSLQAPCFGVLGNHDRWVNSMRVADALQEAGMTILEDASARIEIRGQTFWLAGVSDFWAGRHDLAAALEGIPDEPILLMTHNPDLFPQVPARVQLTVAGHTHGGQVRIPGLQTLCIPSHYGKRYAAGHIVEEGRHLFVTVGVGTTFLPARFRFPPEIVILTLKPAR